jgi:DNA-binding NtrC family response regulator
MQKEKILVVDDDERMLKSIVNILMEKGYEPSIAKNGKEALMKIEDEFFNVLLLDIRLPDMTGIELLSLIKDTKPKMKIIIITGYPDAKTAIDAVNKKADAYLIKPYNPNELLEQIDLNIRQQKEELRYTQEKVLEYIKSRVRQLDEKEDKMMNANVIKVKK